MNKKLKVGDEVVFTRVPKKNEYFDGFDNSINADMSTLARKHKKNKTVFVIQAINSSGISIRGEEWYWPAQVFALTNESSIDLGVDLGVEFTKLKATHQKRGELIAQIESGKENLESLLAELKSLK